MTLYQQVNGFGHKAFGLVWGRMLALGKWTEEPRDVFGDILRLSSFSPFLVSS